MFATKLNSAQYKTCFDFRTAQRMAQIKELANIWYQPYQECEHTFSNSHKLVPNGNNWMRKIVTRQFCGTIYNSKIEGVVYLTLVKSVWFDKNQTVQFGLLVGEGNVMSLLLILMHATIYNLGGFNPTDVHASARIHYLQ